MILTQEVLNRMNSFKLKRRKNEEFYQTRRLFNNEIKETIEELKIEEEL